MVLKMNSFTKIIFLSCHRTLLPYTLVFPLNFPFPMRSFPKLLSRSAYFPFSLLFVRRQDLFSVSSLQGKDIPDCELYYAIFISSGLFFSKRIDTRCYGIQLETIERWLWFIDPKCNPTNTCVQK